jgi:restriction endonuclease S subunit
MSENIFFTKFSELSGNRFDPKYNDYITKYKVALQNSQKLATLLVNTPMYGANESATTYNEKCRYIRITDIDKYGLLKENSKKSAEVEDIKYKLKINDILFARSGATVGKTYIHKDKDLNAIFAGYMIKIEVDETKISPDYIFYYTQLNVYKQWVEAIQRSAGQPNINAEEYQDLDIPIPTQDIQNKIILKMEEAYRLKNQKENEAQNKLNAIDKYLLNELGLNIQSNEKEDLTDRIFIRKLSQISGNRFDSDYYRNYFYQNINQLKENKSCKLVTIGDITKNIFQGLGQNLTNKEEHILLKVKNIQNNNKINFDDVEFIEDVPESKILLDNDIITPFIGEALKKNKFSVFIKPNNNYNYTVDNNTGVIRLKDKYNSVYISAFLMSSIGKVLIKQLSGGGGVPFLGSNSASKLYIPMPIKGNTIDFEKQNTIAKYIQKLRDESQSLKDESNKIYENSKKEVEEMILGDDL